MKKKQVQNQAQQGRSMVEMLGVLAVIGVISIGGIAGYRMAMNRYQANQIANEINLMRTDAKMKVAQGAEKLMLGEPYDSGHLNFGSNYAVAFDFADIESEDEGVTEAGYYIKISGISADVCKPLVTLLNGMNETVALKVNDKEYNADSSTDFCTEESNNALEVDFSTDKIISNSGEELEPPEEQGDEPKDPECNEDTCPGGTCNDEGVCECSGENENWTGTDCITCPTGTTWNDTERDCTCTGANEYWDGNRCVGCEGGNWNKETKLCECKDGKYWNSGDGKCEKNPCDSGTGCPDDNQYCQSGVDNKCEFKCTNNQITEAASCAEKTYKCEDIQDPTEKKINGKTYYLGPQVNWWSAQRYCEALRDKKHKGSGKLVSLSDLGCTTNMRETSGCSSSAIRKALYNSCKEGDDCCKEGDLCCEADSECPAFDVTWVWTSTPYLSEDNSCYAYCVYLSTGKVSNAGRSNGELFALCE